MIRRIKQNYAFLAIAALSVMWPISALPSEIGDWFKSLRVPGTNISCCDSADCGTTDPEYYRTTATGYEVFVFGQWIPVPDDRVLSRPDNPTGRAVLCAINGRVLCFLPGVLS